MNRPNLLHQKFGKLTVIRDVRNLDGTPTWECLCTCGKHRKVITNHLVRGKTTHCGCDNYKPKFNSAKTKLLSSYKRTAKTKKYEFLLTDDEFFELTKQSCFYCNNEPNNIMYSRTNEYTYSGIDRLDNNIGYVSGNCVPCCSVCNYAKRDMTVDQFKNWIKRIYINQYRKISDKSPGVIMDELITTIIKCFYAQEEIMNNVLTDEEIAKASIDAQEYNSKRNKLIRSIDALLDFEDDSPSKKTYTYFKEEDI
jgi:hypothetical protein